MEIKVEEGKEVVMKDFSVKRKNNMVEIKYNPFALMPKKDYKPEHRVFEIRKNGDNNYRFNYSIDNFVFQDLILNDKGEILSPVVFDMDEPVYEDFLENLNIDLIKKSIDTFEGNVIDTSDVEQSLFFEEMDRKMRAVNSNKKRRLITKNGYTLVEIKPKEGSNKHWDIMAKNHNITFVYKNQKIQAIIIDGKVK